MKAYPFTSTEEFDWTTDRSQARLYRRVGGISFVREGVSTQHSSKKWLRFNAIHQLNGLGYVRDPWLVPVREENRSVTLLGPDAANANHCLTATGWTLPIFLFSI